jgi:hypothetical protein
MKKFLVTFIIFALFFSQLSYSQVVKAFVAGGANLAQVDGDQEVGFKKAGANVGIGAEVQINDIISTSIEANFNQKGAFQRGFYDTVPTGRYKLTLNYAEVPVMVHFTDPKGGLKAGIGFSYGRMVSSPTEECDRTDQSNYIIYNKPENYDASVLVSYADFVPQVAENKDYEYYEVIKEWNKNHSNINPNDFSVIASLSFPIWKKFKIECRYSYSLKSFRNVDYYRNGTVEQINGVDYYDDGPYLAFKRKEYNNTLTFRVIYVINERQVTKTKATQKMRAGELK